MEAQPEKQFALRDVLQIYRRRRSVVFGTMLALCALIAIYCIVCTRRYQASGTLQVEKQGADAMGLEELMSSASSDSSNPLQASIELQTQASILESNTLALQTIEALHMEKTYDFQPHWNPISWALGSINARGMSDPKGASLENSPLRRENALKTFSRNLKVTPVTGTRLIEIDYTNPDPKLAAAVVNNLTRALSDYTFQTRYDATSQASKWLSDQLGDLRSDSEELQAKVVQLQRESGVYALGITDAQGKDQVYSAVLDKLQQATAAMSIAEQNRILKGAIAKAAESGDAEMLSGLAGNSVGANSQVGSNSLGLIQSLRSQEATEQAALQQAQAKFGPAYPQVAEIRGNIAGLERSIRSEVTRVKSRAQSDYDIAKQSEASTRKNYEEAKQQADILNNKAIQFAIVREEAEQSRTLYEDLLKRLKEAGVLQGLHSSNVTIVDVARTPAKPKSPNIPFYMAVALFGGFAMGCFGAVLVDTLDNKVNSANDLEEMLKEMPLGVLPEIEQPTGQAEHGHEILAVRDPQSSYIEAMRSIRTALLLSQTETAPKMLLVTSSIAGEGKSMCVLNMGALLAQSGRRTLVIDTDLRRGVLRRRLHLPQGPGLSDLLTGQQQTPPIQHVPGVDNLDILAAGTTPPNPTDLLESEAMKSWLQVFRSQYDFIVLDSAPLLPVTDSVTLNNLTDATILLVRSRLTERSQVQRSYQILKRSGKHYVGLVLNGLSLSDSSYYGYYGYKKYGYHYAESDRNEKM